MLSMMVEADTEVGTLFDCGGAPPAPQTDEAIF
jgi:hypothetical protein